MLPLTHNDYFTTSGTGNDWIVNIKKCNRLDVKDFHDEAVAAAQIIYDTATSPITLMFSGGLDGEFMLNVFKTAKIPFKVAIISYGSYNAHDTEFAFNYCASHNITPIVVDLDINNFIESGKIYDIADSVKCCAYQMPSIMHGISQLDGTIIMANGEPYIKNFDSIWMYEETERVNSYMKWYRDQKIDGTPDFLRYTPEMTMSFLQETRVKELVANKHPGKLSTRTSKPIIYSKHYTFSNRPKYTGWEQIEKTPLMNNEVFSKFDYLKLHHNGDFKIEYSRLLDHLSVKG